MFIRRFSDFLQNEVSAASRSISSVLKRQNCACFEENTKHDSPIQFSLIQLSVSDPQRFTKFKKWEVNSNSRWQHHSLSRHLHSAMMLLLARDALPTENSGTNQIIPSDGGGTFGNSQFRITLSESIVRSEA